MPMQRVAFVMRVKEGQQEGLPEVFYWQAD